MTDEKLVAAMLEIMGYEQGPSGNWWYKFENEERSEWNQRTALLPETRHGRHAFAAEVRGWMMEHGWLFAEQPFAYTSGMWFYRRPCDDRAAAMVDYANMDEHPRAVCEAAIAALEAEKEKA